MSEAKSQLDRMNGAQALCPQWKYLGMSISTGEVNMRLDRELLEQVEAGAVKTPILRLYRWLKPTLSLGLNQKLDSVVNTAELQRLNYDIVRRPTGGRALLHKGDLCYALIARRDWHPEFRSLTSTYRAVGEALRLALCHLGIEATALEAERGDRKGKLTPCFAMFSPFEVSIRGRKVCGSAQRRLRAGFLQHGSLRLADCWDDSDLQAIWPQSLGIDARETTSLEAELGVPPTLGELADMLLRGFAERFRIEIHPENG